MVILNRIFLHKTVQTIFRWYYINLDITDSSSDILLKSSFFVISIIDIATHIHIQKQFHN